MDVTLGRYQGKQSLLEKIPAAIKIWFVIGYILLCVFSFHGFLVAIDGGIWLLLLVIGQISVVKYFKNMLPIFVLLLFCYLISLLTTTGSLKLAENEATTWMNFVRLAYPEIRMLCASGMGLLLSYTTRPAELLKGLKRGLHVKEEHAMSVAIAFSFLPILNTKFQDLKAAQAARGIDIEEGNVFVRLKKSLGLIIPLFRISLEKAEQLAVAMDVRCFGLDEHER